MEHGTTTDHGEGTLDAASLEAPVLALPTIRLERPAPTGLFDLGATAADETAPAATERASDHPLRTRLLERPPFSSRVPWHVTDTEDETREDRRRFERAEN